jgi:hypothetical protein
MEAPFWSKSRARRKSSPLSSGPGRWLTKIPVSLVNSCKAASDILRCSPRSRKPSGSRNVKVTGAEGFRQLIGEKTSNGIAIPLARPNNRSRKERIGRRDALRLNARISSASSIGTFRRHSLGANRFCGDREIEIDLGSYEEDGSAFRPSCLRAQPCQVHFSSPISRNNRTSWTPRSGCGNPSITKEELKSRR